jgi:uncharacterized protein YcgI (DUF1989 family)
MKKIEIIPPRTAVAITIEKGDRLQITDLLGEQVCDLICYNLQDRKEYLSSGRTIGCSGTIFLTKGNSFYSNRNNVMFRMVDDTVGRHNFFLTPYQGCYENLAEALQPFGINGDHIPTCLNIFMYVSVNGNTGRIHVLPPRSKAGDHVVLEAEMDLIVGMTACSAGKANNLTFKPIAYQVQNKITTGDLIKHYQA